MKKYTITVECVRTYEIIANDENEACDIADKMFEEDDHEVYIEGEEEIKKVDK